MTDLLPPEILDPEPSLTDADLASYFDWQERDPEAGFPTATTEPPAAAHWSIDGTRSCAWAHGKWAAAQVELRAAFDLRCEYVQRIEDWYTAATKEAARTSAYFEGHLIRWAVGQRESNDRVPTLHTPTGSVKTTRHAPKVEVTDESVVLEWAREYAPAVLNVKESVRLTELRQNVTVLEVPTEVVLTCGCIVPVADEPESLPVEDSARGSGVTCPACNTEALVGNWLQTRLVPVAVSADFEDEVPGLVVAPESVSAKVVGSNP